MKLTQKARLGVVSLIGAGALVSAGLLAAPAVADSHGCGDDICVTFSGAATTDVTVEAWAYSTDFQGHFQLDGPGVSQTSGSDTNWTGGDETDNHVFTISAATAGTYCVTGVGSDGSSVGTACEHVGP